MTVIRVPRTPASAMNPHRPMGKLLQNQLLHLQEAEFRLPANLQTNIYINKIKTEGEAAEYIRQVTARLHPEAAPSRSKRKKAAKPASSPRFTIAAAGQSKRQPKAKVKRRAPAKKKKRH